MNLEIWGWIAAGIILWELLYIIFLKSSVEDDSSEWLAMKGVSFLIVIFFMLIQLGIVLGLEGEPHYINLLWELLIVVGIGGFFLANYLISKRIKG